MKRLQLVALLLAVGCAAQQAEPIADPRAQTDASTTPPDVHVEDLGVDEVATGDLGAAPRDVGVDRAATVADAGGVVDAAVPADAPVAPDVSVDAPVPRDVPVDAGAGGVLVINEIRAVGEEWVELFNAGSLPIDLSDVQMTDSEAEDGGPRTSRALRFPRGTTLAPDRYLVVVAGQADAPSGPQTRCPEGGPATCYHASWSLSASRGEVVWVLSPTASVIAQQVYPMDAAPDGRSWGRLPNGSGAFAVARPTPGAADRGP